MSGTTVAWSFVGVCLLAGSLVSLAGNGRDTSVPKSPMQYGVILKDYGLASGHKWVLSYMCDDDYYRMKGGEVVSVLYSRVVERAKSLNHKLSHRGGIPYFLRPHSSVYFSKVKDTAMTDRNACEISQEAIDTLYNKYSG